MPSPCSPIAQVQRAWSWVGLVVATSCVPSAYVLAQPHRGVVQVVVTDALSGVPIAGALVTVAETQSSAHTDSLGRARIAGIPTGQVTVRARQLGYTPSVLLIDVSTQIGSDVRLLMQPITQRLPSLNVAESARSVPFDEFESRLSRHIGGHFITEQEIRAAHGSNIANLALTKIPGVRMRELQGGSTTVFSLRGPNNFTGPCQVAVFLDGVRLTDGNAGIVAVEQLRGIEYYSPGFVPVQYRVSESIDGGGRRGGGAASCGVMLLWSRR